MEPKELVQRFIAFCNDHDVEGLAEVISPTYQQHNPMVSPGLAGIQEGMRAFITVFPDLTATIEELIAEGDRVCGRFRWRGTHSAEFFGVPATHITAEWLSSDFWRVEEGKLAEHWDVVDWAGLLGQLRSQQPEGVAQ
jgi:steroid delta-isomerase-like uncharacterized protein